MLKFGKTRILAFTLALMMALVLLPAAALADGDAGHIVLFSDVTDDTEKSYLQTATAAPGDTMTVYVPILNKDLASATDLSCALPVSSDVKVYPFDQPADATVKALTAGAHQMWNATDSKLVSWDGKALAQGERAYFKLSYKIAASTPTGGYTLPFTVSYSDGSSSLTDTVNVYVYVNEKTSSSSSGGGSSYKSKPKVILESYSFVETPIYAGDTVTLRLVVTNPSEREAITNLQLDYSNDAGAILPAPGGSSSIFIGTIDKSDAYAFSIKLQVAPDAEAKSQLLTITMSYDVTRNRLVFEETASFSVPLQHNARVRINDPVVYDDPWVGGTVSMALRSTTSANRRCITAWSIWKTPQHEAEESYFGGNVASGGTMRADLSITPLVGGEVTGNIRVTYEDVYGNQTEQLLPLTMLVNEDTGNGGANIYVSGSNAVIPAEMPEDAPVSSGLAWYWIALIVCAAIGAAAIVIVRIKKKRERSLEDEDI